MTNLLPGPAIAVRKSRPKTTMKVMNPITAASAAWLIKTKTNMEAARPGDVWFAATLHPCLGQNRHLDGIEADARLRRFDGSVAQLLFPGRWRNGPATRQRPWAVLIGQNGTEGFHFHGLLAVPQQHAARFLNAAPGAWRAVAPYGSIDLPPLRTQDCWLSYTTRQLRLGQPVTFTALPYLNSTRKLPFSPPHPAHAPPSATTALAA
ncbi:MULTISPECIES: hypothetical protein [Roseomonadaceae]|uniref:Uncharacterized protein n=1 Tax=Falsiroseomonas oleicola TaxID=2801474 RepID=A0ABS6H410_9PROT|nr:hypothetical protein [Roseomonas oleicola]MBU8543409.1 hypothetical protein [Roseomonas oleicola]